MYLKKTIDSIKLIEYPVLLFQHKNYLMEAFQKSLGIYLCDNLKRFL